MPYSLLLVLATISLVAIACLVAYLAFYFLRELKQVVFGFGMPFVQTPDRKIDLLLGHLDLKAGQTFLDLWCGDGKVMHAVLDKFPQAKVVWYETSGRPFRLAKKRKEKFGLNYEVFKKSIFGASFADANVIYVYMLPYMMPKIWDKMVEECRKWTLLYSSSFAVPGEIPKEIIPVGEKGNIFVYQLA